MTRKDYVKLATALSSTSPVGRYDGPVNALRTSEQWKRDVHAIADVLQADSPRFNRHRFLKAAGFEFAADKVVA